jgi:outer membrane receptor protein involved in Fe transport
VHQVTKTEGDQANSFGVLGEGRYENAARYAEPSERRSHLISLEMELDVGDFMQVVSATAWTKNENHSVGDVTDLLLDLDYDYELFPAFSGFTTGHNTRKQINQEIRFVSTHGGPFNWVIGGFYNNMKYRADSVERLPNFAEFAASPAGSILYGGYYDGLVRPDGAEYVSFTDSKTKELAAFGELTYRPIEGLQLTAGARYFKYDTSITGGSDTPLTRAGRRRMPYPSLEIDPARIRTGEASEDGVVWKFNASYDITPDLMVYGTYSKGYRIGGVNRVVPCILPINESEQNLCALPDELSYEPDTVKNHELGVRASLLDGNLSTSFSVFKVIWDGIQLGSSTQYGSIGITANGGSAESKGFDFSFNARVTPELTIRGNYAYLDAKLTSDVPDLLNPSDASGLSDDVFAGDRLPGSTKNSGAISATYRVPVQDDDLSFNWTTTYTGGILTTVGARGGGERLPSFVLHRASITYEAAEDWEVSIFANNIFDKFALTGVSQNLTRFRQINDGVIGRYYARGVIQPRVIGIESRINF